MDPTEIGKCILYTKGDSIPREVKQDKVIQNAHTERTVHSCGKQQQKRKHCLIKNAFNLD